MRKLLTVFSAVSLSLFVLSRLFSRTSARGPDPHQCRDLYPGLVRTRPGRSPAPDAPFDAAQGWHPDAEAVAVRDGRIVFVGTGADAEAFRGPNTEVRDLAGATVIPGLIESHVHLIELGKGLSQIDLVDVDTEEEAVRLAEAVAAETPPGTWILGSGWDEGAWANRYPTMELLSERVPDHPVYLRGLHGFAGWGNRMAFELAGIGPETQDPTGGQLVRDAQGHPSGVLLNRAILLLEDHIPTPTVEETMGHVTAGLEVMAQPWLHLHSRGRIVPPVPGGLRAAGGGRPAASEGLFHGGRPRPGASEEWLLKGPDTDTESMLRTRSVKAFYDAALGSRGARLIEDYSDMPGHRGVSGADYGFDQELVARMIKAGFQAEIHAIGDAGNRETLDFLERVLTEAPEARKPEAQDRPRPGGPPRRLPAFRRSRNRGVHAASPRRRGPGLGRGASGPRSNPRRLRLADHAARRGPPPPELGSSWIGLEHLLRTPLGHHPPG